MNISLSCELEKFVQNKVASGLYTSASEVIRESLRFMHAYEDLQEKQLNQAIEVGLQPLNVGHKISAQDSYHRHKAKIEALSKQTV